MTETVRRRFGSDAESVREARRFVEEAIAARTAGAVDASDDLVLALSEMATNAVRHAGTPFDVVVTTDGYIRLEVEDGSPVPPVQRSSSGDATSGRGLGIIEDVCDRWGVHVVRDRKCVWCERDL